MILACSPCSAFTVKQCQYDGKNEMPFMMLDANPFFFFTLFSFLKVESNADFVCGGEVTIIRWKWSINISPCECYDAASELSDYRKCRDRRSGPGMPHLADSHTLRITFYQ